MGDVIYQYNDRLYRVTGRDGMKVVLEDVDTGERIKVSGKKFMSNQFRVAARLGSPKA